jgi:hypothetical protein
LQTFKLVIKSTITHYLFGPLIREEMRFLLFHSSNVHFLPWVFFSETCDKTGVFSEGILITFCIISDPCRYVKGTWSDCDPKTNMRSRILTLKKGDQNTCEQTKTIQKKCKKGMFLYFFLFVIFFFWMSLFECYFEHVCYSQIIHYLSTYITVT